MATKSKDDWLYGLDRTQIVRYEVYSSRWAGWMCGDLIEELVARYYARVGDKKWRRYVSACKRERRLIMRGSRK